ncbi:MAG: hypothetical protein IT363_07965 [Methanoregulaceae archaeon]|nr:hypothetical protein [Methanoregulaceae archaeon]
MNASGIALFAIWLAYGFYRWRTCAKWREEPPAIDIKRIPVVALLWLVGSAAILLGGLYAVFLLGGFPNEGITPWAFAVSAAVGVVFVHGQVTAAALLFVQASRT